MSKKTKKIKSTLKSIIKYLEDAGMAGVKELQYAMDAIDGNFADDTDYAFDQIPDSQRGVPGSLPYMTDGSQEQQISLFDSPSGAQTYPSAFGELATFLVSTANKLDKEGYYEDADMIDDMLNDMLSDEQEDIIDSLEDAEKNKKKRRVLVDQKSTKKDEDVLAESNGHVGNSVTQNSGFSGLSDAYFYSGYGNLEAPYGQN